MVKIFLFVVSGFFIVIGAAHIIAPVTFAGFVQLSLGSPAAVIEIQGFYGGQMIGLGIFTLLVALKPQLTVAALILVAADLGFTAMGRVVGMVMASQFPAEMLVLVFVESASAIAALVLMRRASAV